MASFALSTTVTAGDANTVKYWYVTNTFSSPSAAVISGGVGAYNGCAGSIAWTSNTAETDTISCVLNAGHSYYVWTAFDADGGGLALSTTLPTTNLVVVIPPPTITLDSVSGVSINGFTFGSTVSLGDSITMTYWYLTTSAVAPGQVSIRLSLGSPHCSGSTAWAANSQQTEVISCTLLAGVTYYLYLAVDADGGGLQASVSTPVSLAVVVPDPVVTLDAVVDGNITGYTFTYTVTNGDPGTDIYFLTTTSPGAATPAEVKAGISSSSLTDPGCFGKFDWEGDGVALTKSVTCEHGAALTYIAWLAIDADGAGLALTAATPASRNILVRSPTLAITSATNANITGYRFTYEFEGGDINTDLYFVTGLSGQFPNPSPSVAQLRSGWSYWMLADPGCVGRIDWEVNKQERYFDVVCTLGASLSFDIWVALDADGVGLGQARSTPSKLTFTARSPTMELFAVDVANITGYRFSFQIEGGDSDTRVYFRTALAGSGPFS
jgi:hypothetical protein